MNTTSIVYGLLGGVLIGISAGAFLILNGRIAGISGILGGVLTPARGDTAWRLWFVAGLLCGGLLLVAFHAAAFPETIDSSSATLVAAGLLVGFGTRLGNGCTSGHGVCGMARLSPRSIVATITFIAVGAVTVVVATRVFGG